MSDTDTDSLSHPRRSDSEPERHEKSTINTLLCNRGLNVFPNSVDFEQFESSTNLGNSLSIRSAHQPTVTVRLFVGFVTKHLLNQPVFIVI